MMWLLVAAGAVFVAFALARFYRAWVRSWDDVEEVVEDIVAVRAPKTFILDGNPVVRRIGIALESVFLRQRELSSRAKKGEIDIKSILGAMRDGLAVTDNQGRIRVMNPALRSMFSISDEHVGETVLDTFRDHLVADAVAQTLRGSPLQSITLRLSDVGDGARRIMVTSLPVKAEEGSVAGAVILFHDATQLQQLEQVRREFVSNVSHELRTPLSIFRGYVETLLEEPDLPRDERERIFKVMEKHSSRLNSLVDDLLSLARLEAPDPRLALAQIDIADIVQRAAADWAKKAAARNLTICCEVANGLPQIWADELRIEEILYNLIDNAVKYSRPGGKVTLGAAVEDKECVAIRVTDEGAGIAADDLPRIFERFYRADKARSREVGGTGLGLAIVKHIAELHDGSVDAQSLVGQGTTVRVLLPIFGTERAAV